MSGRGSLEDAVDASSTAHFMLLHAFLTGRSVSFVQASNSENNPDSISYKASVNQDYEGLELCWNPIPGSTADYSDYTISLGRVFVKVRPVLKSE